MTTGIELTDDEKALAALLDGNVESVVAGLEGKTAEQLEQLLAGELHGKNRKGVVGAIEALLAPDEPVVTGEFPTPTVVASDTPTPQEARAMFEANESLAEIVTTEGVLKRSGVFANKTLGLDGIWR